MEIYYYYSISSVESLNIYKEIIERYGLEKHIIVWSMEEINQECMRSGKKRESMISPNIKRIPALLFVEKNGNEHVIYLKNNFNGKEFTMKEALYSVLKSVIEKNTRFSDKKIKNEKCLTHVKIQPNFIPPKIRGDVVEGKRLQALKDAEYNKSFKNRQNFTNDLIKLARGTCLRDSKGRIKTMDPKSEIKRNIS
jgi:hypothetical protein